jgi:hypothetical protein
MTMPDPYNHVGKQILAECEAKRVTYKFACKNKIGVYLTPEEEKARDFNRQRMNELLAGISIEGNQFTHEGNQFTQSNQLDQLAGRQQAGQGINSGTPFLGMFGGLFR